MPVANELNQSVYILQCNSTIMKFAQVFNSNKRGLYNFAKKDLQDKNLAEEIKNFTPSGSLETDAQSYVSFLNRM